MRQEQRASQTAPVSRPSPGPRFARGDKVSRYLIRGLVGRGAMGEVYRAYDPELGRHIAIKLVRADVSTSNVLEHRARLLQEARAMARICHPNVITVHDVGTFDDGVFIAMEFVAGSTVRYWLLAEPRPWKEILRIFVAAGRGLAAAHAQHVIHHDFKPDNVMIGNDGEVRVTDFGLARELRRSRGLDTEDRLELGISTTIPVGRSRWSDVEASSRGAGADLLSAVSASLQSTRGRSLEEGRPLMGTPAYMSPEQFLGGATDARTDQFSFCVALHEALYDRRPFSGPSLLALRANVFAGRITEEPAGTSVPRRVRRVLLRGMAPNPAKRFSSMKSLLWELGREVSPRRQRRRPVLALVACGVAVLGAVLGARALAINSRETPRTTTAGVSARR
jgi:serine/threonine protein kinase